MDSPVIYWLKCNDVCEMKNDFCEPTKVFIHFYKALQRLFINLEIGNYSDNWSVGVDETFEDIFLGFFQHDQEFSAIFVHFMDPPTNWFIKVVNNWLIDNENNSKLPPYF